MKACFRNKILNPARDRKNLTDEWKRAGCGSEGEFTSKRIAGGQPKTGGIAELEDLFPRVVRAYLVGEAQEMFAETLKGKAEVRACGTIEAAAAAAFADAAQTNQEAIVLLSDGLNTENRFGTNASQIDARQKILCDNAKAANITIYTVQVNTGSDPTSQVLQYCAQNTSSFYLVTSAKF